MSAWNLAWVEVASRREAVSCKHCRLSPTRTSELLKLDGNVRVLKDVLDGRVELLADTVACESGPCRESWGINGPAAIL